MKKTLSQQTSSYAGDDLPKQCPECGSGLDVSPLYVQDGVWWSCSHCHIGNKARTAKEVNCTVPMFGGYRQSKASV